MNKTELVAAVAEKGFSKKDAEKAVEYLKNNNLGRVTFFPLNVIEGKSIDSVELSKQLETLRTYGNSSIVFVIGGSNGLSDDVKKRSNYNKRESLYYQISKEFWNWIGI